ncbi:ATP-binding protein [Streptomyces albogriseolus]
MGDLNLTTWQAVVHHSYRKGFLGRLVLHRAASVLNLGRRTTSSWERNTTTYGMRTARGMEMDGMQGAWGPWDVTVEDAHRRLARYANADVGALTRHRLWVDGGHHEREEDTHRLLADLYQALRDKERPYEKVPWNTGSEQIIRDIRMVDRSCATCLDLALLYASMCLHKRLRPYIVLLSDPEERLPDHALVLIAPKVRVPELGGVRDLTDARHPWRPLDSATPRTGETHVYFWMPTAAGLDPDALAIDVRQACRHPNADFAAACAEGRELMLRSGYRDIVLIDILALQTEGYPPFAPLPETNAPAITSRLPARPRFHPYAARQKLVDDLVGATGTVVLYGEQGSGKSMLAHQIAAKAQYGSGWFLAANDQAVLTAELGDAEMAEQGVDPSAIDRGTRATFAKLAQARLREAPGSWVVVLDNVDVGPDKLTDMPVPLPHKGQLVVVTTTAPEWLGHHPGVVVHRLEPLPDADVKEHLGREAPLEALHGRPLLVSASNRFREATGGRDWWTGRDGLTADGAPHVLWAAVRDELAAGQAEDAAALGLAAALAWLPPAGLDLDVVAPVVATALAAVHGGAPEPGRLWEAAQRLSQLGMVDLRDGRVLMHRLLRTAVRHDVRARDAAGAAALLGTVLEELWASIDAVGHAILCDAGGPMPPAESPVPYGLMLDAEDIGTADSSGALEDLLGAHPNSAAATRALHALAGLVERQDEKTAARIVAQLRDAAPAADGPAGPRLMTVNALRSSARAVYRDPAASPGQVTEALGWMERCDVLCAQLPGKPLLRDAFRLTGARAQAMYGLLLKKRGASLEGAARLAAYRESERLLQRSAAVRAELVGDKDSPDLDRSKFNLAGVSIELAKHDDPACCKQHLDLARSVYQEVLEIRERRLGTRYLEEVACCVNGLGLVAYYEALLLPLSHQQRINRLREAAGHASAADALRAHSDGPVDRGNTLKSVSLSARIALARLGLSVAADADPGKRAKHYNDEYDRDTSLCSYLPALSFIRDPGIEKRTMPLNFPTVPLAASGDAILPAVDDWIRSEAMRALVTAFDGDEKSLIDSDVDLAERVEMLYAFSERWQNRAANQERNEAADLPLTPQQTEVVLAATAALGLHDCPPPRHTDYDHVLLLGGLVRACFNRPAYAAQLCDAGQVRTASIVALGGHRPFRSSADPAEDEFRLADRIGHPELTEEYQALDAGTRAAFRLEEPEHVEGEHAQDIGGTWGVRHYHRPGGGTVRVAAAPSSDPATRRAHTGDTYAFFAERMERLRPGARLLLVTTPIYTPSQHFTALHRLALPYQVQVETVGGNPVGLADALHQPFSATRYLAEVRTALRSLRGLVEEASRATGGR